MQEILKKELRRARREFKALPNSEEYDYFCVSVYFTNDTEEQIKLVMDSVAVKNSNSPEVDSQDVTLLGKQKVLSENIFADIDKIYSFLTFCSKQYKSKMVIFLPKPLIHYHGLDGKKILTATDLCRIIHFSISRNDFSLWDNEVGFRIDRKKA